jgi:hypothetical protein
MFVKMKLIKKVSVLLITGALIIGHYADAQIKGADETGLVIDLKVQGTVNESESVMRVVAPQASVDQLLGENPVSRYFCFTEDRMHDIRLDNAIPARWTERSQVSRTHFAGTCAPGEFYTWQIGLYAPFVAVEDVRIIFSDLTSDTKEKIPSAALRCFNLSGIDPDGKAFTKQVDVPKDAVQAFWIGIDVGEKCRPGTYRGKVTVAPHGLPTTKIDCVLEVKGAPLANHGDDLGARKTRLRWLDAAIVEPSVPTAPYTPIKVNQQTIRFLGGIVELANTGLPKQIITQYDQSVQLDDAVSNPLLNSEMIFVIETAHGIEPLSAGKLSITRTDDTHADWKVTRQSSNFEVIFKGRMDFDGFSEYEIAVTSKKDIAVKDIRMEAPFTAYASKYLMGLGKKGGLLPTLPLEWKWDVKNRHQDKLWVGNVNVGMNIKWKDDNYVRPLVNIYYSLGSLQEPVSWGNHGKGGINVIQDADSSVLIKAYSGERFLKKGETVHYGLETLITPVKPRDFSHQVEERFYHASGRNSTSDIISKAKTAGANFITIHHAADIYPFINYPYYDESLPDLKQFIRKAHNENIGVRVYYTTRELTVKLPELWALRSLGNEIIHDGPGKDARTKIHPNGPNEWLVNNFTNHFIPAWYNTIHDGKFKDDLDISIITTPDSRWNNYYLNGLDWMVKNVEIDGIYIDDSALDRKTIRRGRRILDADGKRRIIDLHSWNHMNQFAGYANSIHLYMDMLPYIDRTWLGEGFRENNSLDFWMVEMSGIPFGLMSETLGAQNIFRGLVYGMLPRLPWSGNPVPLWKLWDTFGMKEARMSGYWDTLCPVKTGNENLPATVYVNNDKALVVIANWTDVPQWGEWKMDESLLGFTPSKVSLPEIEQTQWSDNFTMDKKFEVMGRSGLIILLEK